MNILWMSNAEFCPSGYGIVTANVCHRLKSKGYDVSVLAYYGLDGAMIVFNGLPTYPRWNAKYGEDAAELCIKSLKPDVFVTLFDVWVGINWLPRMHPRWIAYVPIDHDPIPPPVEQVLRGCFMPVAMSRFGQAKMKEVGIESVYIPHGVDVNVFKPSETNMRDAMRGVDNETFIAGIVAANVGDRKEYSKMFEGFKLFLANNPDARDSKLYCHTWARQIEGHDLLGKAEVMGIRENTLFTPLWNVYCGVPIQQMAELYNSFDVFMNCSHGEGFGIPILEAQACGVPVIATEFTSMIELVEGHGWLIPPLTRIMTALNSYQVLVDENKIADALSDAYNHPDKRKDFGRKSAEFAQDYDYDKFILPMWEELLKAVGGESELKPNVQLRRRKK